jgi:hypothetical protein
MCSSEIQSWQPVGVVRSGYANLTKYEPCQFPWIFGIFPEKFVFTIRILA